MESRVGSLVAGRTAKTGRELARGRYLHSNFETGISISDFQISFSIGQSATFGPASRIARSSDARNVYTETGNCWLDPNEKGLPKTLYATGARRVSPLSSGRRPVIAASAVSGAIPGPALSRAGAGARPGIPRWHPPGGRAPGRAPFPAEGAPPRNWDRSGARPGIA